MNKIMQEIEELRKVKLGLDKIDTNLIFNKIISVCKSKILNEQKNVIGYTIDIVLTNMNGINKLGDIEHLYQRWGDIFYLDFNNSVFCKDEVDEESNIISNDSENFLDIKELLQIKDVALSLKEMIEICSENNINIKLFTKEDNSTETTIEIKPYVDFNLNEKSIKQYLSTLSK